MIISIVSPIIQGVYEGYKLSPIYTGSFYCFRMSLIHIFSFYLFMCLFGYLLIYLFLFILYCLDSQRMDGPSSSHTRQVRILGIFQNLGRLFCLFCFFFVSNCFAKFANHSTRQVTQNGRSVWFSTIFFANTSSVLFTVFVTKLLRSLLKSVLACIVFVRINNMWRIL